MSDGSLELAPLPPTTGRRTEQVIEAVRAAIDAGRMRPGVKYSAYQLAEMLDISRTPVRDALLRLEEIGLIKFEARQGFRILLPQPREIAEIFAVRIALELPAVRAAARRSDATLTTALAAEREWMRKAAAAGDESEFAQHDLRLHDLILEHAGNTRARSIVRSLRETTRLLGASTATRTRTPADIDAEHAPIIAAIGAGDPSAAADSMRSHLVSTGRLLVRQALGEHAVESVDQIWSAVVEPETGAPHP